MLSYVKNWRHNFKSPMELKLPRLYSKNLSHLSALFLILRDCEVLLTSLASCETSLVIGFPNKKVEKWFDYNTLSTLRDQINVQDQISVQGEIMKIIVEGEHFF